MAKAQYLKLKDPAGSWTDWVTNKKWNSNTVLEIEEHEWNENLQSAYRNGALVQATKEEYDAYMEWRSKNKGLAQPIDEPKPEAKAPEAEATATPAKPKKKAPATIAAELRQSIALETTIVGVDEVVGDNKYESVLKAQETRHGQLIEGCTTLAQLDALVGDDEERSHIMDAYVAKKEALQADGGEADPGNNGTQGEPEKPEGEDTK